MRETWKKAYLDYLMNASASGSAKRTGIRLKFDPDTDHRIREEIKKFCVWLRKRYAFPMRVVIYVKNQEQLRTQDGDGAYGTFFAPYDHSLEPYVRIAVGDYVFLLEQRGEINATYAVLECLAHELTHYYQWLAEWETDSYLEEKQAKYCARQVARRYWKEHLE